MDVPTAANLLLLILTSFLLLFAIAQVNIGRMTVQQSVLPILVLRVKYPEVEKGIYSLIRDSPEPYNPIELLIAVRNGIALEIKCRITKNGEMFLEREWNVAIPPLKTEGELVIHRLDVTRDIENLSQDEKLTFKAFFTYRSIMNDEYKSEHTLSIDRSGSPIQHELRFIKRPRTPRFVF